MTKAKQMLMNWFDSEYRYRTYAVSQGTASIDWVLPEYRITWTEICAKAQELGITENAVDLRLWWDRS